MSDEKYKDLDRELDRMQSDKSTLSVGAGPAYVIPKVCVVCKEETDKGLYADDTVTNQLCWFCYECHNMSNKVKREDVKHAKD